MVLHIMNKKYKGWSIQAICGLLGNIEYESYLNPSAWQSNKKDLNNNSVGYGLVQFTPASKYLGKSNFKDVSMVDNLATNPEALIITQLNFIIKHCQLGKSENCEWLPKQGMDYYNVPYYITFEDFIKSTNGPAELALVFHGNFERSAYNEKTIKNRCNNAQKWYDYFKNKN